MTTSTTHVRIAADHPAFDGHFPGQPLLPGVALVALAIEAALADAALAPLVGAAPGLAHAKFLAPVRPGDELELRLVAVGARLSFELRTPGRVVAAGQFDAAA